MSRSGYSDDYGDDDHLALGRWLGAVNSAIRGKRGQQTLREILEALDAMPTKWLAAESLVTEEGEFCTLGVLGAKRGIPLEKLDPEDPEAVAEAFGIAPALVREIVYLNDEGTDEYEWVEVQGPPNRFYGRNQPTARVHIKDAGERRWQYMRAWVASHITPSATASGN